MLLLAAPHHRRLRWRCPSLPKSTPGTPARARRGSPSIRTRTCSAPRHAAAARTWRLPASLLCWQLVLDEQEKGGFQLWPARKRERGKRGHAGVKVLAQVLARPAASSARRGAQWRLAPVHAAQRRRRRPCVPYRHSPWLLARAVCPVPSRRRPCSLADACGWASGARPRTPPLRPSSSSGSRRRRRRGGRCSCARRRAPTRASRLKERPRPQALRHHLQQRRLQQRRSRRRTSRSSCRRGRAPPS